jgi:hypothetical protein
MADYATRQKPSRSHFVSAMCARSERPLTELDQHTRRMFRLKPDAPPQVITFGHFSPDPWTIVGANGANLATFSGMVLTVIKATTLDGQPTIYYVLAMNVMSDGWSPSAPDQVPTELRVRIDFSAASGGLLASFEPFVNLQCGTNNAVLVSDNFGIDVFSLITSAHLSLPGATFWPC